MDMLEEEELPWWTEEEQEQVAKELHFLKQPTIVDQKRTNIYRDINWMYFRQAVLDKYRNNKFCEIGEDYIRFLSYHKSPDSIVHFVNRNFANIQGIVLMMQAQDYIFVPLRQRPHWERYEIAESEIQFL
jgi:hypothetical protein